MVFILNDLSKINLNHLDIKPCNFLIVIKNKLNQDYEIKLSDFGTAR